MQYINDNPFLLVPMLKTIIAIIYSLEKQRPADNIFHNLGHPK